MMRALQFLAFLALLGLSLWLPYRPGHLLAALGFAAAHPVLLLMLAAVFGILYGLLGGGYGLPGLFWHERLLTRLGAATAVTLLMALIGTVTFFVASRQPDVVKPLRLAIQEDLGRLAEFLPEQGDLDFRCWIARFLVLASPPFLALLVAPALLPGAFPRVPQSVPSVLIARGRLGPRRGRTLSVKTNPWGWVIALGTWFAGIALGVGIVAILLGLAPVVETWTAPLLASWKPRLGLGEADAAGKALATFLAVVLLVYAALSFKPVYDRVVSPAFAICALIGLLATFFALIAYFLPPNMPWVMTAVVVGLVVLFALMNADPYKLRFPKLDAYYPGGGKGAVFLIKHVREIRQALADGRAPAAGPKLIDDEAALADWRSRVEGADKPKLVVVSVSGGALRSGLWVAIVLDRLEQEIPGFGRHVRLITGASGGMLGAAYYLLHRRASIDQSDPPKLAGQYVPSPWVLEIPRDSISPVARYIALRDPVLSFLPRVAQDDRGIRLEEDWQALLFPFRNLAPHEASGAIPSMVLSPLIIDSGRRLLISNLDLNALVGSRGPELAISGADDQPYSLSALEFYRLFPEATDFRLATGVRMNASFPYVSPAVNLPTDPPQRITDAGIYDNYGIQVAAAWLEKNRAWLTRETSGVVLVQIRDAISIDARLGVVEPSSGLLDRLTRGFRGFTSPPEAAESARTSSASFRNDEDVANLAVRFEAEKGQGFFTTVIFENSADVSYRIPNPSAWPGDETFVSETTSDVALDWYLTRAERDGLISAIPNPTTGSRWADRAERLRRIDELRDRLERSTGAERRAVLKQFEQAENYEHLARLQDWWP